MALSLVVALLAIRLVVVPCLSRASRPSLQTFGWVLARAATASAAATGCAVLLVRAAPALQGDPGAEWLLGGLIAELGLVLTLLALGSWPSGSFHVRRPGNTGFRLVRVGVASAAGALLLAAIVGQAVAALGLDASHGGNVPDLTPDQVYGPALVTGAVLPGALEELFFRGLLFRLLRQSQPIWLAMLVSSGLFALGHLSGGMVPLQLVQVGLATFVAGCVYAMAYVRTGSLAAAVVAYLLFDVVPTTRLTLGAPVAGVLGVTVIMAGYLVFAMWYVVPAIRRWRTVWPFPQAYTRRPLADARQVYTVLIAKPAPVQQRLEPG